MSERRKDRLMYVFLLTIAITAPIALAMHIAWPIFDRLWIENVAFGLMIVCGGFGAMQALKIYRVERMHDRMSYEIPNLPTQVIFDVESGYAAVTTADGTMRSIAVPEEVTRGGPQDVTTFILHELGFEQE